MKPFSINISGRLLVCERPLVMGIINITPDSFYAGSRVTRQELSRRACELVEAGADWLDLGACSTRPGSVTPGEEEELSRLAGAVSVIKSALPDVPLSVDTFRAKVAETCLDEGADIVNDISGGDMDDRMFEVVASRKVPYILMHMRGTPETMQQHTDYSERGGSVVAAVIDALSYKIKELELAGVSDVIIDPGFGFSKTMQQNYELLEGLERLHILGKPILAGMSRKSMATKLLDISADDSLNACTALNALAITKGAAILRVHDPREAAQAIKICMAAGIGS